MCSLCSLAHPTWLLPPWTLPARGTNFVDDRILLWQIHQLRSSIPDSVIRSRPSRPAPGACSGRLLGLLHPFATDIGFDENEALVKHMPIRVSTSLQGRGKRQLDSSAFGTASDAVSAFVAIVVVVVFVDIIHFALVESIPPVLVFPASGERDEAVVRPFAFHFKIQSHRCRDNGVQLLFPLAQRGSGPRTKLPSQTTTKPRDPFEHGGCIERWPPFAIDLRNEEVDGQGTPKMVFFGFHFVLDGYRPLVGACPA